jgi:hypothetical protein
VKANPVRLSTCAAMAIAAVLALPAATNTTAAAMPWCGADSLSLRTSPPISPGQQVYLHFYVILTNVSRQPCTLQGYPGVDLVGPDDPMLGPTYSLPRESGDVRRTPRHSYRLPGFPAASPFCDRATGHTQAAISGRCSRTRESRSADLCHGRAVLQFHRRRLKSRRYARARYSINGL